jgi:acetyl esterase/lipase
MKRVFVLGLISLASILGSAAKAQNAPNPAESPVVLRVPGMEQVKVENDLVYATAAGMPLRFDLYRPPASRQGGLPAIVFVSGGEDVRAWKWYQSYGRLAASKSIVGIVPAKRYARGFDGLQTGYADTDSILTYIRANASRLGIDPSRICVWAFSAGGRLMSVALSSRHASLRCVVGYYPLADATQEFAVVADTVRRKELLGLYSPSHVLVARGDAAPPVFIVRAGKDSPVINSAIDRFVAAATAANAALTFINYPEGLHGFDAYNDTDESRRIIEATFDFVRRATR